MSRSSLCPIPESDHLPDDAYPDRATREEFLDLLRELVRFRSTAARPEALQACAARICSWLLHHNLPFTVFDGGGVPSILVGPDPSSAPVLLLAHYDVVEADSSMFEMRCRDGMAWGRGCYDDKYAVVLLLLLLRRHALAGGRQKQHLPFSVLFTGDEELGGSNGAGGVSAFLKPQFCLALDGGGPRQIVVRQPGVLRLGLTRRETDSRGPACGRNAYGVGFELAKDCVAVHGVFTSMQGTEGVPDESAEAPCCLLWRLCSGDGAGCLRGTARAEFDIRYHAPYSAEGLRDAVAGVVSTQVEILENMPPLEYKNSHYLQQLLRYMPGSVLADGAGAGDAHYFAHRGVSCAVVGAEGFHSQHSANERLHLASVYRLMYRLDAFLQDL